jgi:hypothetical protein
MFLIFDELHLLPCESAISLKSSNANDVAAWLLLSVSWTPSSPQSRTVPAFSTRSAQIANLSPLEQRISSDLSFLALCLPMVRSLGMWHVMVHIKRCSQLTCSSKINGDVGGRTQMASLVCSVLILLAIFVLLPYLYFLPKCVLASV